MDKSEIRAILSAYRAGEPETQDPRFAQARAEAEADPELAQWWAEQQELDRVISAKLLSVEVPRELKTQLTAWEKRSMQRSNWNRGIMLAAASIVALAVLFGSWRGPFQPAVSLADYRDEMVSFVKLDPPLELESSQLTRLTAFLEENGAPSGLNIPQGLQRMDAAGCRTLRFRGHDVALICFKRDDNGELVHLFVVDRKAVAKLRGTKADRQFAEQGEWMTATWVDGEHAYLFAAKGTRPTVEKFLGTS
jgi:hypothetical protein